MDPLKDFINRKICRLEDLISQWTGLLQRQLNRRDATRFENKEGSEVKDRFIFMIGLYRSRINVERWVPEYQGMIAAVSPLLLIYIFLFFLPE